MTKLNIPPPPIQPRAVTAEDHDDLPQPFTFFLTRHQRTTITTALRRFNVGPTLNRAAALLALCKHVNSTSTPAP